MQDVSYMLWLPIAGEVVEAVDLQATSRTQLSAHFANVMLSLNLMAFHDVVYLIGSVKSWVQQFKVRCHGTIAT
jgi:hypothetical protein